MIGPCPRHEVVVMAVRKAVSAATTTFTAISTIRLSQQYAFSFPLQIFFNSEILCFFRRIASHWGLVLPHRLSLGSGTDVKSLATFSSGPDPSERLRRNARRNAPAEAPRRVYPCAFCSAIQSSSGVTFLMNFFLLGSVSSGVRSIFSSTP